MAVPCRSGGVDLGAGIAADHDLWPPFSCGWDSDHRCGVRRDFKGGLFFYRAKTPIEPRHTPKALITSGPFKYSRNPIYLGMVLILIGWVLVLGALSPVLIPYLYFWMVDQRFAAPEEEGLRHAFGVEGLRYIQTTPRWI